MFMRVRTSRPAILAVASVLVSSLMAPVHAHIVWGGGGEEPSQIAATSTVSEATSLAFSQSSPVVVSDTGSIPTTATNTQFAANLVTNVDGNQRVVLHLRYANGTVYSIVNSDASLASQAASTSTTIQLTNDFYFATENGQSVVKQKIYVNGVESSTTWGRSSAIVNAFTLPDGSCRHIVWGGGGTIEDTEPMGEPPL